MKRFWMLALLLSVGLNLGLGWVVLQKDRDVESRRGRWQRHERSAGASMGDSLRLERFLARRTGMVARRLDLMPGQIAEFEAIQKEAGPEIHASRRKVEEVRSKLDGLMGEESPDRERIEAAVAELGRFQAALDSLIADSMLREMEILDREQRARYLKMVPFGRGREPQNRGRRNSEGPGR